MISWAIADRPYINGKNQFGSSRFAEYLFYLCGQLKPAPILFKSAHV